MQLLLCGLLLAAAEWSTQAIRYAQWLLLGLSMVLASLLLLRLPGDLLWRPRRSKRTSREVVLERQRIARDLHDHVGSRIVGVMARLDRDDAALQPLAQALEQCLLELRLVVDSMDGDDDVLPGRLARLRHRLQPALDQRGIALRWNVGGARDVNWPSGEAAREFSAIVQEAISNILQHADATELSLTLQPLGPPDIPPEAWCLQVRDNGRGLQAGVDTGQGLANMRRRAERQGAHWELVPVTSGGTCVQVTMPASARQSCRAQIEALAQSAGQKGA